MMITVIFGVKYLSFLLSLRGDCQRNSFHYCVRRRNLFFMINSLARVMKILPR